jgi:peptide/nickel transport system permease protein
MILPVATLTVLLLAHIIRQTRSELIEVLQSEYVRSARLKGLTERTVLVKHALRNGLLPTITVLALNFGWLMGSLVVVEEIFAYPGLGRLVVFAIQNRDIPLLQFIVIIIAVSYTFANFGADLLYGYLDPQIDYGEGE